MSATGNEVVTLSQLKEAMDNSSSGWTVVYDNDSGSNYVTLDIPINSKYTLLMVEFINDNTSTFPYVMVQGIIPSEVSYIQKRYVFTAQHKDMETGFAYGCLFLQRPNEMSIAIQLTLNNQPKKIYNIWAI